MWLKSRKTTPAVSQRRRTILKLGLFGAAAFAVGKIVGPSLNFFSGSIDLGGDRVVDFNNFRVVENGTELGFYDKFGNEILVLDKDSASDSGK
ncbi:MAG TPA: hypothetical protein VG753_02120 [Candidatus Paceibacterota bacterium]|nr:hypothetical protein [Candidatus Paceibacterota bacterium]